MTNSTGLDRRRFLETVGRGLLVGAVAAGVIAVPGSATADPPHKHCMATHLRFRRFTFVCGTWVKYYDSVCNVCLGECGSVAEITGAPC